MKTLEYSANRGRLIDAEGLSYWLQGRTYGAKDGARLGRYHGLV